MGGMFGSSPKTASVPTISKGQKSILNAIIGSQLGLSGKDLQKFLGSGSIPRGFTPKIGEYEFEKSPLFRKSTSYLDQLLSDSPQALEQFQRPYMRQYEQEIVPQIAERFAGIGGMSSSGFNQAMAQSGRELAENLASMREQLRSGASDRAIQASAMPAQQRLQILQTLLGTQAVAPTYTPGSPGILGGLMGGIAGGIGQGVGGALGGGLGKTIGKWF